MGKYIEFDHLKQIEDKQNPFCVLYEYDTGDRFYVEPLYYMYLQNFKIQYPREYETVLNEMERIVKKNHKVIFTGMDEEFEDETEISIETSGSYTVQIYSGNTVMTGEFDVE